MDIRQLRYFAAIAEEGQITRAAKKLHMAQPPLSYQLKTLEEELGQTLFERNGKAMELTEAGRLLYERTNELFRWVEETTQDVQQVGKGLKGNLAIGSVKSSFSYLPERIKQFRDEYPEVTFQLYEGDSYRIADYLLNRDIEIGIVRLPLDLHQFHTMPLPTDQFVCVLPKSISCSDSLHMSDLAEMPIMLLHRVRGVGLYELVIDTCRDNGLELNVICHCPDTSMLLTLVRAGVGAALLPLSAIPASSEEWWIVKHIEDLHINSESAVIWLKNRRLSKQAERFLDSLPTSGPKIPNI
ncbi:LysR family transcriptional regulator [Pradoshia sp.]|uniref:LysR family transcriptional regulator n=1 Tax=Pradoshia sp. TaxID=2651281 RepID=UPI003F10DF3B